MFKRTDGFQANRRVRQYTGKGWLNRDQWAWIEDVPYNDDLVAVQFIDYETDALMGERIMKKEDFEPREHKPRKRPPLVAVVAACVSIIAFCYGIIYFLGKGIDSLLR